MKGKVYNYMEQMSLPISVVASGCRVARVVAEANASVTIVGGLLSVDQNDPVVRIYYGLEPVVFPAGLE